jgi:hypothetical protein
MPAERHKLRYQGRRGVHIDVEAHLSRPAAGDSTAVDLIAGDPDGLAARLVVAGAGAVATVTIAPPNSGTYVCVLSGRVAVGARNVGPLSLGWVPAGEDETLTLSTDADAAAVLVLSFPYPPTPAARADATLG